MIYDLEILRNFYGAYPMKVDSASKKLKRPLTLAEKILFNHCQKILRI